MRDVQIQTVCLSCARQRSGRKNGVLSAKMATHLMVKNVARIALNCLLFDCLNY